jgi:hypothetical protein
VLGVLVPCPEITDPGHLDRKPRFDTRGRKKTTKARDCHNNLLGTLTITFCSQMTTASSFLQYLSYLPVGVNDAWQVSLS